MAIEIRDGDGSERYLKAAGAGSIGDPFVPAHSLEAGDNNIGNVDIASALPAGTNAIGTVDIAPTGTIARAAVNLSASGALVAAGTNKIKVLGMMLMADADLTVTIEDGSGGTDLIPAIPFAVDGNGFVLPMTTPGYHWIETGSATALYATITGTGNLTGVIVYIDEA